MAKISDLIRTAEEEARAARIAFSEPGDPGDSEFRLSDPEFFPKAPSQRTERIRAEMREQALASLFFMSKVVLGYSKLRVEPHGELCAALDFLEQKRLAGDFRFNRSVVFMPRDTYKTTICTIARAIQRGCRNPNTRGLILADTGLNAARFGMEISNHFKYNELLRWLFSDIIPENFNTARWNTSEMVLKRTEPWREPTFDMMGAGGGIETRHYDWIIPDDLVTEKHIHSDVEMDRLIKWLGGLEPLLVSDTESSIDFVGSRKKKGDAYEHVLKYYGAKQSEPRSLGPHFVMQGGIAVYSRSIVEDGRVIFPYDPKRKSGISREYITRMRTFDPERYHAQLANDPKGSGLNWFRVEDLRFFTLDRGNLLAVHEGKVIERTSIWSMQRILLFDPSVAERDTSSKNAFHLVAKGSGPNRYILESKVGHIPPDECILLLFDWYDKWKYDFVSIEKRGFQGWVKYALNMIAELQGRPYLPIVEFPPEGSPRSKWSKKEHIRALQPIVRSNLLWLQSDQLELVDDFEFFPNVRWDDSLDALAQGVEYWPYSIDEAEIARAQAAEADFLALSLGSRFAGLSRPEREPWDEQRFLASLDATGYGIKRLASPN